MNKTRLLRTLVIVALIAAAIVALHRFDLLGALRRLHGMA
jgi:hypothetical protein